MIHESYTEIGGRRVQPGARWAEHGDYLRLGAWTECLAVGPDVWVGIAEIGGVEVLRTEECASKQQAARALEQSLLETMRRVFVLGTTG